MNTSKSWDLLERSAMWNFEMLIYPHNILDEIANNTPCIGLKVILNPIGIF